MCANGCVPPGSIRLVIQSFMTTMRKHVTFHKRRGQVRLKRSTACLVFTEESGVMVRDSPGAFILVIVNRPSFILIAISI